MRYCNDQIAEAAGVLSAEVWDLDVRVEQTLSDDGEATQPRPRRSRNGLCETPYPTRQ